MLSSCLVALGSGRRGLNMSAFVKLICFARALSHSVVKLLGGRGAIVGCVVKLIGDTEQAAAVTSDCWGLGLWLRGSNRTGVSFVDVKLLGFEVCGSNWYLLGGMLGGRVAMPRGLLSLRWSTEPQNCCGRRGRGGVVFEHFSSFCVAAYSRNHQWQI